MMLVGLRGAAPRFGARACRAARGLSSRCLSSAAASWESDDGFMPRKAERSVAGTDMVFGETLDPAIDLKTTAAGDVVVSPYELTVDGSMRDFWCSAFHSTNRLVTSTPFSQRLGFTDRLLPFDMMLFLTGAMAHADKATEEVAFKNARYYAPAYAGDTFRKRFVLRSKRAPSKPRAKRMTVATFECELWNQREELVFSVEKAMMFPLDDGEPATRFESVYDHDTYEPDEHTLRKQIVKSADLLGALGGVTLRPLDPGKLFLHGAARMLTATQTMQLAALGRVVHDRHFNPTKYGDEDPGHGRLYVPGAFVLALVNACAGRELHEILFQTMHHVSFVNHLHPNEVVSALSYVRSRSESLSGELEKQEIVTIGVKNLPDATALEAQPLPRGLFLTKEPLRTHELKDALKDHPILKPDNVVLHCFRSIYRQAPKADVFLL